MCSGRKKQQQQPLILRANLFPNCSWVGHLCGNPHDTQTGSRAASRAAWMIPWNWHAMDQWLVRYHSCTNFQNLTSRIHRYDGTCGIHPVCTPRNPHLLGRHPRIHSERLWWSSATHGIQWLGTNFPRDMDRRVLLGEHENWWKSLAGWWFGTFFMFPYIGNNAPNWLSYFSAGLKPPTRWVLMMLIWGLDWTWADHHVSWRGVFLIPPNTWNGHHWNDEQSHVNWKPECLTKTTNENTSHSHGHGLWSYEWIYIYI